MNVRKLLSLIFLIAACGPSERPGGGFGAGGADSGPCAAGSENTPAACSDGQDNDCDGLFDCSDPDCSGVGACPVCGMVEHPTGMPVQLPDGVGGTTCVTDTDCPTGQHCFEIPTSLSTIHECRASYVSTLNFTAFGPSQQLTQVSDIQSVCVNMSHEWLRDLEIDLRAPNGQLLKLQQFEGQNCPTTATVCEVFLGHPNNTDGDCTECTVEQGYDYCWKPTATNAAMLPYVDGAGMMEAFGTHSVLPAGDYGAAGMWSSLVGVPLNGNWQLVVTDLWPIDAGVIHSWTLAFNPSIVQDCSGPVIQ